MDMNRRTFLGFLGAATIARTYFFAPVGGWHSDLIVHPSDPTSSLSVAQAIAAAKEIKAGTFHYGRYSAIRVFEEGDVKPREAPMEPMIHPNAGIWMRDLGGFEIIFPKRPGRKLNTLPFGI